MFTIYKKIPEILVRNFRSVRTVCVVYHLPKISGLSRRAGQDFSYHMKLHSECPNGENGTTFSDFPFVQGIFRWDERLPFTSQPKFPGICGKWLTTKVYCGRFFSQKFSFNYFLSLIAIAQKRKTPT